MTIECVHLTAVTFLAPNARGKKWLNEFQELESMINGLTTVLENVNELQDEIK